MHLVFYYAPRIKDQNKGINLSPDYCFQVKCMMSESGYIYELPEDEEWEAQDDIYKDEKFIGVSAIVGENGSGKTTLIKKIIGVDDNHILDTPVERDIRDQYIYIFVDEAIMKIYYKMEDGSFNNKIKNRQRVRLFDTSVKTADKSVRKQIAIV